MIYIIICLDHDLYHNLSRSWSVSESRSWSVSWSTVDHNLCRDLYRDLDHDLSEVWSIRVSSCYDAMMIANRMTTTATSTSEQTPYVRKSCLSFFPASTHHTRSLFRMFSLSNPELAREKAPKPTTATTKKRNVITLHAIYLYYNTSWQVVCRTYNTCNNKTKQKLAHHCCK